MEKHTVSIFRELAEKGSVNSSETVITTYQTTPWSKADHIMNLHHYENKL
jgi:hypothetical protein